MRDLGAGTRGTAGAVSPGAAATAGPEPATAPIGLFYAWWRGDPLPDLPRRPALTIAPTDEERLVAGLTGIEPREVRQRLRQGHRPWLARTADEPVGSGWVAAGEATIAELGITLAIPPGNRYLWDFVTVPAWRGRGIYPRLLHAILVQDVEAERFWVGRDLGNVASGRGIVKAGFGTVGAVYRLPAGGLGLVPAGPVERAVAAATLLDVPVVDHLAVGSR